MRPREEGGYACDYVWADDPWARGCPVSGLPPGALILEITESAVMGDPDRAVPALRRVADIGVKLSLDDFGTGYSSLSYLHQFPIDTLKIDRSFVSRIGETEEGREIVHTIMSLAQSLDMEVVAEGVETEQQLQMLRDLRCSYAQGYHLSRPVAGDQFEALLGEKKRWAAA